MTDTNSKHFSFALPLIDFTKLQSIRYTEPAFGMGLFAKEKRPLPPTCPTDDIIPVHLFDGSAAARDIIMAWTYKFDEVLDPCAIHDALTQLFQMDGWRKFSGRFRPRVSHHQG